MNEDLLKHSTCLTTLEVASREESIPGTCKTQKSCLPIWPQLGAAGQSPRSDRIALKYHVFFCTERGMRTVDPKSEVRGRYRYRLVVGALPADRKPHGSDRRGLGLRDQARR